MKRESELYHRLMDDLAKLNMPIEEVLLCLRPFSKTYYGRYFPDKKETPRIYIYPYDDKFGRFMPYSVILDSAIHEMVHHIQHTNPSFVRTKGVMHNPQFWQLYNHFIDRAVNMNIIDKEGKDLYEKKYAT